MRKAPDNSFHDYATCQNVQSVPWITDEGKIPPEDLSQKSSESHRADDVGDNRQRVRGPLGNEFSYADRAKKHTYGPQNQDSRPRPLDEKHAFTGKTRCDKNRGNG